MSGFWELLVLDPGPSGPGASWTRGLVDPGRRGRIPEYTIYSITLQAIQVPVIGLL